MDSQARVNPCLDTADEVLGEPLGLMEAAEQEALEELLDGLDVDEEQREELAARGKNAVGDKKMSVRMEIGRERTACPEPVEGKVWMEATQPGSTSSRSK